jgi:hypothetical protein
MKKLVLLSSAALFSGALFLSSCAGSSSPDVSETKEQLNDQNNPSVAPNTTSAADPNATVQSTNATNPQTATAPAGSTTKINFEKMEHNFGNVKEGNEVMTTFKFKNTGDKPLIISNAQGSCGCTVPDYPKEPVAPGASAEIKVKFNSKGKKGQETKFVTLTANTDPAETRLTIKANVIGAEVKTN